MVLNPFNLYTYVYSPANSQSKLPACLHAPIIAISLLM